MRTIDANAVEGVPHQFARLDHITETQTFTA